MCCFGLGCGFGLGLFVYLCGFGFVGICGLVVWCVYLILFVFDSITCCCVWGVCFG